MRTMTKQCTFLEGEKRSSEGLVVSWKRSFSLAFFISSIVPKKFLLPLGKRQPAFGKFT